MSGICGLFQFDDAPVTEADLGAMTAMLAQRGPDAQGCWKDASVGFGHTLLRTTPGSLLEVQPLRHEASGCVVVADVRLDYRDELVAALALESHAEVGDAELILESYLRWGESCVDRLFGDFSFAIRDPRSDTLFCARDRFGLRPFYHHHAPGQRFAFASDARAILVLRQVPFAINEGRIADFIVPELEWIDYTSTFFEDVFRLPPAHTLTVSKSGLRVSEYWQPTPGPRLQLSSDEEYCDAFREVFTAAVRARIDVPNGAVGCMLSGGMDSGSVAAIANKLTRERQSPKLRTFSLVSRSDDDCLETRRIRATVDFLGVDSRQIAADDEEALLDSLAVDLEEPFDGAMLFLKAIYEAARHEGIKVVLDGAAGDLVFNEGAYIARLLRRGRLAQGWREIAGEKAFWAEPSVKLEIFRHLRVAFGPEWLRRPLRGPWQRRRWRGYLAASMIDPEFASRIDITRRFERMRATFSNLRPPDPGLERARKIRPNLTAGRERYGRIAASASVEARDPFTDQRVVDFCTGLPDDQCARDGWPKFLLRNALASLLPDEVRWGCGKPHIGGRFNQEFITREKSRGSLHLDGLQSTLRPYMDPESLRAAWIAVDAGGPAEPIHSAFVLSRWLAETANRPVVQDQRFG